MLRALFPSTVLGSVLDGNWECAGFSLPLPEVRVSLPNLHLLAQCTVALNSKHDDSPHGPLAVSFTGVTSAYTHFHFLWRKDLPITALGPRTGKLGQMQESSHCPALRALKAGGATERTSALCSNP